MRILKKILKTRTNKFYFNVFSLVLFNLLEGFIFHTFNGHHSKKVSLRY